jgi:membrane-associated phospholipid phosphatase
VRYPLLVPPRFRWAALLVAVLGWCVAAVLGVRYAGGVAAGRLDDAGFHLMRSLVGNPAPVGRWAVAPPTVPTRVLASLSSSVAVCAVIGVGIAFAAWRRRWEVLGLAVLAPGLCALVTEVVMKPLVDRRHEGSLSYPSGHMVMVVSAFTVLVLAVCAGRSVGARVIAFVGWLLVAVCLAAGLVAMDYHYPTDTVGALGVGLGVVLPGAIIADRLSARRSTGRGTAPRAGTPPAGTSSDIPRPASPR